MPVHDEFGLRMKKYEHENRIYLNKKEPVIIRIDGKAFHTFTKGFKRPFDELLIKSMQETMKYLCENIENCVLGYHQSDEISLILVDYKNPETQSWFNYNIQKMCSIAASMATMAFNKYFIAEHTTYTYKYYFDSNISNINNINEYYYIEALTKAISKGAMFDARCFNIPIDEVTNCIYWRQLDAIRNSIQMVGQANFSHKELQNKSCKDIKEMLIEKKNIDWTTLPLYLQRGSCCIKTKRTMTAATVLDEEIKTYTLERPHWEIDKEIPLFKAEGRKYIDELIYVGSYEKAS